MGDVGVVESRSAAMAEAVVWARVWRRLGIIAPRPPLASMRGGSPCHRVAVGSPSVGNSSELLRYIA